jgi:hypothetical protein
MIGGGGGGMPYSIADPSNNPPVPTRRQNSSNTSRPLSSDKLRYPPQPCESPPSYRNRVTPPVPTKRTTKTSGDSPPLSNRHVISPVPPYSSVQDLLAKNNLHHYTKLLLDNGYDNIKFLSDITSSDLTELGITDETEKTKLLKIFSLL